MANKVVFNLEFKTKSGAQDIEKLVLSLKGKFERLRTGAKSINLNETVKDLNTSIRQVRELEKAIKTLQSVTNRRERKPISHKNLTYPAGDPQGRGGKFRKLSSMREIRNVDKIRDSVKRRETRTEQSANASAKAHEASRQADIRLGKARNKVAAALLKSRPTDDQVRNMQAFKQARRSEGFKGTLHEFSATRGSQTTDRGRHIQAFKEARKGGRFTGTQGYKEFSAAQGFKMPQTRGKKGKGGSGSPMGIDPTASSLLALSSILGPLNSQLGATVMQAGFAAFEFGAIPAALSLAASAVAGFIAVLKKSLAVSKEAGLQTVKWFEATTRLNLAIGRFMKILGVRVQEAFEPVVDEITEFVAALDELPWSDIISFAASATEELVLVAKILKEIGEQGLLAKFNKKQNRVQDFLGLKGDRRVDFGNILSGLFGPILEIGPIFDEFKEIFGKENLKNSREFMVQPTFGFESLQGLGKSVQQGIFKSASKDPLLQAADEQNMRLKDILSAIELGNAEEAVPIIAVAG